MLSRSSRQRAGYLAAVLAVAATALSACGSSASTGSGRNITVLKYAALNTNVDSSTGAAYHYSIEGYLVRFAPLKSGATKLGSPFGVVPDLATKYRVTPQGVEFTLRTSAQSQWGNRLTAQDVAWSFERAVALDPVAPGLLGDQSGINTKNPVTVLSASQVRINANKTGSITPIAVPFLGAWSSFAILDSTEAKKHATKSDPWAKTWMMTHSASFGPYMVKSIVANSRITFGVNPHYYGAKPGYTSVQLALVTDASTAQQLLKTGQAQAAEALPSYALKSLKSATSLNVETAPQTNVDFLALNKKVKAFRDPKVREAISLAIDRQALLEGPYSGFGVLPRGIAPSSTANSRESVPLSYNLARAKALLAQSSYPHGLSVSLAAAPSNSSTYALAPLLTNLKAQLGQLGIRVQVNAASSFAEYLPTLGKDKYDMFLLSNQSAFGDALTSMYSYFTPKGSLDYAHDNDPSVNQAIASALAATTASQRASLTNRAVADVNSSFLDVPIMETKLGFVVAKSACGFAPTTNQYLRYPLLTPCRS